MKILYTNALKSGDIQTDPLKSIGGYVSSSEIPNDILSNLFSEVTTNSLQSRRRETILVAFKNESSIAVNLKIQFLFEDVISSKMKIALINPIEDNCGDLYFEKIPNSSSLPLYAEFEEVKNEDEFEVGVIQSQKIIGMWLCRELLPFDNSCEKLKEIYEKGEKDEFKIEKINIKLTWEDVEESESSESSVS